VLFPLVAQILLLLLLLLQRLALQLAVDPLKRLMWELEEPRAIKVRKERRAKKEKKALREIQAM
jgi:hypothetical protein